MITPHDIHHAKRALGHKLAALRQAAGLRQEDLANAVHLSRSSIANTETGHQVSARDFWTRCDQLLGANGDLVATYEQVRTLEARYRKQDIKVFGSGDMTRQAVAESPGTSVATWGADMDRQGVLRDMSALRLSLVGPLAVGASERPPAWEEIVAQQSADFATRARRSAMEPMVLERLEEELRRISWEYLYSPRPRAHFSELVVVRDQTFRQIESERPRPDQARLLYSFAGVACALLAQSTHELGFRRAAMSHAHAAFVCAELAGHASLQVWIRATQAAIAEYAGLPREAVRYAEAGRELGSRGTAVVRLISLGANGHARMGDLQAAREALAAAERARNAAGADDPLDEFGGVFSVSLAKQHAYAASALALLGQGMDAATEAGQALELYQAAPPERRQPINEAYAHIDVAYARLLSGEIDGVSEALAPVLNLPAHARVDLLDEKLRRLHRQISEGPHGPSATARELQGRIEEFVATLSIPELP